MAAGKRYQVFKAPPKPTEPPCRYCEDTYWRYNGRSWYVCDRVTKRRHACTAPAAIAHRRELEAAELGARRQRAIRNRRQRRAALTFKITVAAVVAAVAGLYVYRDVTAPSTPSRPSDVGFSHSETRYAPLDTPTAKCADGTLSYAAHHQGACSWHGGVLVWYR